ncbi:MAG: hypothetical protein KF753_01660 [Caldilineaceae bacterium]|nr:hypothetical protein [Caldilineaceae bacterium]
MHKPLTIPGDPRALSDGWLTAALKAGNASTGPRLSGSPWKCWGNFDSRPPTARTGGSPSIPEKV